MKRVAVDLFSGAGGLSAGLIKSNIKIGAAVEIWKPAISTYRRNIETSVIEDDIRNVSGGQILKLCSLKKGELFLLSGCPPCQGFSKINLKRKNDDRNKLVYEFIRLVDEIQPLFVLMENVSGIKNSKTIFNDLFEGLDTIGYVAKSEILNAADFGAAQKRKRFVLHGFRKDIFKKMKDLQITAYFPQKTHSNKPINDLKRWRTLKDVISDLPAIKAGEENLKIANHKSFNLSDKNKLRLEYIRTHNKKNHILPEELQLECHKRNPNAFRNVYGVLEWDEPAPTMTGGCLIISKGRYGHPEQNRGLSAREAARIQSFADDYIFEGSLSTISKQIGNALPIDLAFASGKYFMELGNRLSM
jgi:DNA (cytosine-5)-methyltransferase 1